MAEVTDVTITAGVPTAGTGTVPTLSKTNTVIGAINETPPTLDTDPSGLNGRLVRIAQRLTSLIALIPAALGAGGGLKVDGSGTALPVSGTVATTVADNANATIGAKADAKASTSDATPISAMSVWKQISFSIQAVASSLAGTLTVASHAVTNAGTFAVQATLAAGSALIGKVDIQVAGSAPAMGSGANGATVIRTALATDSPGIIATGTAGTPSAAIITVQGVAGATPQTVGGVTVTQPASSTITRPADTTAYASGDLVANSTTAGSVANLQFTTLARVSGGSGVIVGAQIQKSTNSVTNAAFRLHLFNTAPTYTSNGDNTAMTTVVVASAKGYLGYIDITAMVGFSDVSWGSGAPDNSRGGIPYVATAQIIYGLLEARGAYTPGNAEVFTITVDALQD